MDITESEEVLRRDADRQIAEPELTANRDDLPVTDERFIDAFERMFDGWTSRVPDRMCSSRTLTLLKGSTKIGWNRTLELLTEFIHSENADTSCMAILCKWIEKNGGADEIRSECETYLRDGITEEEHSDLEDRFWMSPGALDRYFYLRDDRAIFEWESKQRLDDANPATERPWLETTLVKLSPSEWAVSLDSEELVEPEEEDLRTWRMPNPGSPTELTGMSVFESLLVVLNAGVLTSSAEYGMVARNLDPDYNLGAIEVLCEYVDSQGQYERFAEYFSRKTQPQIAVDWRKSGF